MTDGSPEELLRASVEREDDGLPRGVVERLPALDPEALGLFYDAWFERVYGTVRRMVGEEHLAEDLTQDVFMRLQQAMRLYDPARPLSPWVLTIATNRVRDYWRSRRHQTALREVALDDGERPTPAVSKAPGPSGLLEGRELGQRITRAVGELPESMRVTLILRYFEGLSFAAIGRIVDRNETAVRKRYSRALEALRASLGPELGPGGEGTVT